MVDEVLGGDLWGKKEGEASYEEWYRCNNIVIETNLGEYPRLIVSIEKCRKYINGDEKVFHENVTSLVFRAEELNEEDMAKASMVQNLLTEIIKKGLQTYLGVENL